jgi:hypothetical protein
MSDIIEVIILASSTANLLACMLLMHLTHDKIFMTLGISNGIIAILIALLLEMERLRKRD